MSLDITILCGCTADKRQTIPFDSERIRQARQLGRKLEHSNRDIRLCSPDDEARVTAEVIAGGHADDLPVRVFTGLMPPDSDHALALQGMIEQIGIQPIEAYTGLPAYPFLRDLGRRGARGVIKLARQAKDKKALLVCNEVVLSAALDRLFKYVGPTDATTRHMIRSQIRNSVLHQLEGWRLRIERRSQGILITSFTKIKGA